MKFLISAQKAVALVFLLSLFAYFIVNINRQQYDIAYGLRTIAPADSILDYPEKTREIEDVLNKYTYRRSSLINLYAYIQTWLGKEENGGFDLVRSKEGALNYGDFYHQIPRDMEVYAMRVRRLKDYANSTGCEVLFLNTPPMHVEGYHTYSAGLPYQDENLFMDAMLFYLQGLGVDYYDMRLALNDSGLELSEYRYKTDNHWTIEASFEGFRGLVRELEDKYGESIDPDGLYTSPDNYSSIFYPNGFVGSLGERAGLPFSETENFNLIFPMFSTSFSTERDDGMEITRTQGDFYSALIDGDYLLTRNLYMSYLGGLSPFLQISNHNNPDGLRILFLGDSFTLPLAAFLASATSEVDMIYTLSQDVFGYSVNIDEYVVENAHSYDYIFVVLSPGDFSDSGFSFFRA